MIFADRVAAGRALGPRLGHLRGADAVVVGVPRGGVPVAAQVAAALDAPLDVIVVRKLGVPSQPELAMGAIGEGGVRVVDDTVIRAMGISHAALVDAETRERAELDRRIRRYRGGRAPIALAGRTVVMVDDGIATGSSIRAACRVARAQEAARIVVAVPVAPPGRTAALRDVADEAVSVQCPDDFGSVGQFYADFAPPGDGQIATCLEDAAARTA
jgi:putative phosphoribosyl transferase